MTHLGIELFEMKCRLTEKQIKVFMKCKDIHSIHIWEYCIYIHVCLCIHAQAQWLVAW